MIIDNIRRASRGRGEIATTLAEYEAAASEGVSQRYFAQEQEVARTTLQYWLKRRDTIDDDPAVIKFFESPAGLAVLHRIAMAAHFVITLVGPAGIRQVCLFLELSRLDRYVAASYGSQQKVSAEIERQVVKFGTDQQKALSQEMKPKQITVCEDETFHPEICLVAIEPVSNFILLEQYEQKRDAASWNKAMDEAIKGLPVKVIQVTSDEGKGLLAHISSQLGVHHSPDLFHTQHDLSKATTVALASHERQAQKDYSAATDKTVKLQEQRDAYHSTHHGPGRPLDFEQKISQALETERQAKEALVEASVQREEVRSALQAISSAYHPYDLETGLARSSGEVAKLLKKQFRQIERVAKIRALPARCMKLIDKAKKMVIQLVATILFYHQTVTSRIEALGLEPNLERAILQQMIPGFYLQLAAGKASTAEEKWALLATSEKLLTPLKEGDNPLEALSTADRQLVEEIAWECAELFQRSSSCVEGRNGQLALRHHSWHKLRPQKLKALTVVHNYFIKRPDGSTAAERFFGAKPGDLFDWLLSNVGLPARPAERRSLLHAA